ncbi:hypothetical protein J0A68_08990 [Algoriphagus sp. H41]|uniref:Peptidase M56 domain-containing protein n=1 Tax=Algoriphagus oliviformis TaxID=2811231 RepID=A0ABS3C4I1_9BACT|nr:M56 family metallopeptidase [Algoriphagus oliviformis]MBN7811090.1 hypothetical protein [Algoriphagus oliviformis]
MDYLLKSIVCLLALLLIHRLLLQREVLHRFNRYYLLAAVLGSFLIPLFTIEVEVERPAPIPLEAERVAESRDFGYEEFSALGESLPTVEVIEVATAEEPVSGFSFPWKKAAWIAYFLVSAVFLYRFAANLISLIRQIRRNPHLAYRDETLVLHPQSQSPFSFLRYIFVSRHSFEREGISDAVFAHERCHVRERHSWDVLLVEVLLVPFWFHPGLYLARHAIRLNHEFIADQAALGTTPVREYQRLLLGILSANSAPAMVSSLNFSLTKKRMQMMNKKPNSPLKWLKLLALVPLVGALVYFFGEKVEVQPEEAVVTEVQVPNPTPEAIVEEEEVNLRLLSDDELEVDGQIIYVDQLGQLLEDKGKDYALVRFSANPGLKMGVVEDVQQILRERELRKVVFEEWEAESQNPNWEEDKEAYFQNAYILVEDENMEYTPKAYQQLSVDERNRLLGPVPTFPRKPPHPMIFEEWKNKEKYKVLLDREVIPNEELENLLLTDIAIFFTARKLENATSDSSIPSFHVHLFTNEYYKKELGPGSERQKPLTDQDTITLTQRKVTWHKDIQKYPDPTTAYLQKNARYEKLRTSGTIYIHKSPEEKALLDELYQGLRDEYSKATENRKKNLKEPIAPDSNTRRFGTPDGSASETAELKTVGNGTSDGMAYSFAFSPQLQSKSLKEYLSLYGQYQTRAYENRTFSQPSQEEILAQQMLFRDLEAKYSRLSFEDRRKVTRATFPYAKLKEDGKEVFVKIEDLSPEQRKELGC